MKKIKVLLLGAAFSADLHADGYARIRDKAEIVAIADKDQSRIRALVDAYGFGDVKMFSSFEQAIDETDCDLVDICLPNFLHHAPAVCALNKGRDIICEKPFATTVEDGEEMLQAAAKNNRHIYYAEDWLFSPAIRKALDYVDEGGIGDAVFYRLRECHSGSHSPFAQKIQYCGGGSMIHLGIHPVGLMLALKKNQWTELTAMTSGGGGKNMIHKTMEGEDWAAAIIKFKDGTSAIMEGNYVTLGGMEDVIDIYGTSGCIHIDLTFTSAINAFSVNGLSYTVEKAEVTTGWSRPAVDEKFNLGYVREIAYFVECCAKGVDADVGMRGVDALESLKVIGAIYQSAASGKAVKNPAMEG